jgi:hypothetical protein
VFPEHRGGTVFRALEAALEPYARDSGFSRLYAGVTSLERLPRVAAGKSFAASRTRGMIWRG